MSRVFIVGWDGATFDLIRPWVADGKLPNIARLLKTGAHGLLRSTMPPMTFPAWSSFMTGKNPGKHGIYDFTRQRLGSYELEFVNGGQRRAASFWQILSEAGKEVISISVPCTFPPEPVNGVMISGFDAPGLGGKGSTVDARGVYPPELVTELEERVGKHPIGSFPISEINRGRPDLAVEAILKTIRQKAATTRYLMTTRPWDCLMILFGESDGVGHHFWKYCDPNSPQFTSNPPGQQDSILKVYQELDRQLGELQRLLPEDTTLLMMSDHGFGGVSDWILYPNCWLHEAGFLSFKGRLAHKMSRLLDAAKLWGVAHIPSQWKRAIYRASQRRLGGLESRVRYAMLDWPRTQAYFEENPYYPFLWINLKGRQPQGTVAPGEEYAAVRDRLIRQLEAWKHPETGAPIVEKAFRREELYSGPCLDQAPDIIVKWGEHNGYTYAFKLSSKSPDLRWIEQVDPHKQEHMAFFSGKSGSHRDDGIFLAAGPAIRANHTVADAEIIDLAPTILHLLDLPVPADMDGKVLTSIFTPEFARQSPVRASGQSAPAVSVAAAGGDYSAEDEELIADRLRNLGYL